MSQIFVSHSREDKDGTDFINRAFASTKVEAKYEEIEAILQGQRTAAQIGRDILQSNALFVLLGKEIEKLRHTRDWVAWESGVAAGAAFQANKDIWVFEPLEESSQLSVVIPHLRHHVCFEMTDPWLAYIRAIVSSYDDSHFLPAALAGAGIGAGIASARGAVVGGIAALILAANKQSRPTGLPIQCPNCHSNYSIHRDPARHMMRCPVCNSRLLIQFPALPQF
jgi:ribosomal protein S27E